MSKTAVNDLVADIKILADYNITDTDLDAMVISWINLGLIRLKQWLLDEGLYIDIGKQDTFATTADQEYVEILTETVDFDESIVLTERDNDTEIQIITYAEYKKTYPDPTTDGASSPVVGAFFGSRLYLGPTPDSVITLYLDYVLNVTKVAAGGTLPFNSKYDELLIALAMVKFTQWIDSKDRAAITTAREEVQIIKHDLLVGASKNISMDKQRHSRNEGTTHPMPRRPV